MGNNIFEKLKWNKKFVKLSITALIGAIVVYGGISYSAKAMKPTDSPTKATSSGAYKSKSLMEDMLLERGRKSFLEFKAEDALSDFEQAVALYGRDKSVKVLSDFYDWYSRKKETLPSASPWRAEAMCKLGKRCERGIEGVIPQDKKKAVEWYQLASALGNAEANRILGKCYMSGIEGVIPQNMILAFQCYQNALSLGDVPAKCCLGMCYERGIEGVIPQNMELAAAWYKEAADSGDTEAKCRLGVCYSFGKGVEQDKKKAVELLQQEVSLENAMAMCTLGEWYMCGNGVERNHEVAFNLFQRAAKLGNASAMYNLGACYQGGNGVDKNIPLAIEYYQKAVNKGIVQAAYNLGVCYEIIKDMPNAIKYFTQAVDQQENVDAMYKLGTFYKDGYREIKKNIPLAIKYFQKAADKEDLKAMYHLGLCYEILNNMPEAIKYFKQSADKGCVRAMYKLGAYYQEGNGVDKNIPLAIEYFQKAAKNGYAPAKSIIAKLKSQIEEQKRQEASVLAQSDINEQLVADTYDAEEPATKRKRTESDKDAEQEIELLDANQKDINAIYTPTPYYKNEDETNEMFFGDEYGDGVEQYVTIENNLF